jgi:hypothetical protein
MNHGTREYKEELIEDTEDNCRLELADLASVRCHCHMMTDPENRGSAGAASTTSSLW